MEQEFSIAGTICLTNRRYLKKCVTLSAPYLWRVQMIKIQLMVQQLHYNVWRSNDAHDTTATTTLKRIRTKTASDYYDKY
jgi:hypothetical protein